MKGRNHAAYNSEVAIGCGKVQRFTVPNLALFPGCFSCNDTMEATSDGPIPNYIETLVDYAKIALLCQ